MKYKFTGNGLTFTLMVIFLTIMTIITVGLVGPYLLYWVVVYFIEHTEVVKNND